MADRGSPGCPPAISPLAGGSNPGRQAPGRASSPATTQASAGIALSRSCHGHGSRPGLWPGSGHTAAAPRGSALAGQRPILI